MKVSLKILICRFCCCKVLDPEKHEPSSEDEPNESDDEKSKKKKRKKSAAERKEAARQEEERLQRVEQDLLDPNRQLSSCDDFDRMVLANPNNSAIWMQYMAFHLQVSRSLAKMVWYCFLLVLIRYIDAFNCRRQK